MNLLDSKLLITPFLGSTLIDAEILAAVVMAIPFI